MSLDGYGAGPDQDLNNPIGVRGTELMEWFFNTRAWRRMHGHEDGEAGVDNAIAERGFGGSWSAGERLSSRGSIAVRSAMNARATSRASARRTSFSGAAGTALTAGGRPRRPSSARLLRPLRRAAHIRPQSARRGAVAP